MAHILVAEDERDIRELIQFTLTFGGHTVTPAANGVEALGIVAQVMPDLVMMDVRMPKMSGYEACRQMKQMDGVKDIPVVFLSAKGQDEEVQVGLDAGAIAYILKPFSPEELNLRVNEILAQAAPPEDAGEPVEPEAAAANAEVFASLDAVPPSAPADAALPEAPETAETTGETAGEE